MYETAGGDRPMPDARMFSGPLGRIAKEIEPHSEADPAGVMVALLGLFSAAIGPGPGVSLDDRNTRKVHRLAVWPVLVGPSGKGKGTSTGEALAVFQPAAPEFARGGAHYLGKSPASGAALVKDLTEAAEATGYEGKPGFPALFIDSEWGSVLRRMAASEAFMDAVCLAWDGGERLENKTKKEHFVISDPHAVFVANVTPGKFALRATPELVSGGAINRYIYAYVRTGRELPFGGGLSDDDYARMARRMRKAIESARGAGLIGWGPGSREAWRAIYSLLRKEDGRPEAEQEMQSRWKPYARRIAALYALSDGRRAASAADMWAAYAVVRYSIDTITFVMRKRSQKPSIAAPEPFILEGNPSRARPEVIEAVTVRLKRAGPEGLTASPLLTDRQVKKLGATRQDINDAVLAMNGQVTVTPEPSGGAPRHRFRWISITSEPAPETKPAEPEPGRKKPRAARAGNAKPAQGRKNPPLDELIRKWK